MSNETLKDSLNSPFDPKRKPCPEYFKAPDGNIYECIGNDENKYWTEIGGESKGFEQQDCEIIIT